MAFEAGHLAKMLDMDPVIRHIGRTKDSLTQWENPKVIGVPSCAHLKLNVRLLEIVTEWWLPKTSGPSAINIACLRKEAFQGSRICGVSCFAKRN